MQYNPYQIVLNCAKFKCKTCNTETWMFPKSQEEVDNYICLTCTQKQSIIEHQPQDKSISISKGEKRPRKTKQTSLGTGKKRRKNAKKGNKNPTTTDDSDGGNSK